MSKIRNWQSGTGSYKIGEIALKQGVLHNNWDSIPSQVDITDDIITFNGDSEVSNINLIKNNFFTLWKKYKIRFRTVLSSTSTGSTFGLRYWNAPTETTKDDSGNSLINEGWHTLEGVYLYAGSGSLRLQIAFAGSSDGDEVVIDNLEVYEIPHLPTITTGTKYLECTTAGTAAIQSKQAYGTWEFDVYKGADGNSHYVSFIADIVGAESASNGYSIKYTSIKTIALRKNNIGSMNDLFITTTSYITNNTWYRLKIARLQSEGVFKDIPTLQTSDTENSVSYPYDSFTSNGRNGFRVTSDGGGTKITGVKTSVISTSDKVLIEFDLKINSGTTPNIGYRYAIDGVIKSNVENTVSGRNSIILTSTSLVQYLTFYNLSTVTDYEISGLTIRRIYPADTFAVFIKNGSFGDNWTLVDTTGGSGSNPVVDSTYTTSEYFVADLDAGDRLANIKIMDGVKQ